MCHFTQTDDAVGKFLVDKRPIIAPPLTSHEHTRAPDIALNAEIQQHLTIVSALLAINTAATMQKNAKHNGQSHLLPSYH